MTAMSISLEAIPGSGSADRTEEPEMRKDGSPLPAVSPLSSRPLLAGVLAQGAWGTARHTDRLQAGSAGQGPGSAWLLTAAGERRVSPGAVGHHMASPGREGPCCVPAVPLTQSPACTCAADTWDRASWVSCSITWPCRP